MLNRYTSSNATGNPSDDNQDEKKQLQGRLLRLKWHRYRNHSLLYGGGLLFLLAVSSAILVGELKRGERIPLVVLSLGGFRHDYIEQTKRLLGAESLPNFDRFAALGTRVMRLVSVFPTTTLPNHQTMLTGLYPQHHGVTANTMRDERVLSHLLSGLNDSSLVHDAWLDDWPEPIWVTAQRNYDLNTASHFWPITERVVGGQVPRQRVSKSAAYNALRERSYHNIRRIDDIIQWLRNNQLKTHLILAYISESDAKGHIFGPNSLQQAETVAELDKTIGYLLDEMTTHDLLDRVNVVLISDHGMTETTRHRAVVLSRFVESSWYSAPQLSSTGYIYPIPGKFEAIYDHLKNAHPHMKVFKLEEVPTEYHFNQTGPRMPPLLLEADLGWIIVKEEPASITPKGGQHGYSPNHSDMHGFFMASGPSFFRGILAAEAYTIDIYSLLCRLLAIQPNPHNGSLARISRVLWPFPPPHMSNNLTDMP